MCPGFGGSECPDPHEVWTCQSVTEETKPRPKPRSRRRAWLVGPGCLHLPTDRGRWPVWWRAGRACFCGPRGTCCTTQPWSTLRRLFASPRRYPSKAQKTLGSTKANKIVLLTSAYPEEGQSLFNGVVKATHKWQRAIYTTLNKRNHLKQIEIMTSRIKQHFLYPNSSKWLS